MITTLFMYISFLAVTLDQIEAGTTNAGGFFGRRRLLATNIPNNQISNAVLCLEQSDMVFFKIRINETDRTKSNYPVYDKDHLFSTNPSFDFGQFTDLGSAIKNTNANISTFAFVFSESGNYVFYDNADNYL